MPNADDVDDAFCDAFCCSEPKGEVVVKGVFDAAPNEELLLLLTELEGIAVLFAPKAG